VDALVVSDLHYVRANQNSLAQHEPRLKERRSDLGRVLLREMFQRLQKEGIAIDLAIVLGDVVDYGGATGAEQDMAEIARMLHELGVPVLAVPGNHDGDPQRYGAIFGNGPGLFRIERAGAWRYGFYVYRDWTGPGDVTVRPPGAVHMPVQIAAQEPELPLVMLQHNPLHPPIERTYPYVLANAAEVMDAYREAQVVLSLSGHYHDGQAAHEVDGVIYYTVPALCEAPFRFARLSLMGRHVELQEYTLEDDPRDPKGLRMGIRRKNLRA
jgi:Icc-related predicted phosphoesterase